RALTAPSAARFFASFVPFQDRIAQLGMVNSLSQVILKIFSPGVPDFYQGSELWDLSLVDPDNRRPVDFTLRERLFDEIADLTAARLPSAERLTRIAEMLAHWQDGRIK